MNFRSIFLLIALILGAMGSSILMFWNDHIAQSSLKIQSVNKQQFEAKDVKALRFTAAGTLQYSLQGQSIQGDSGNHTITIQTPMLSFLTTNQNQVVVTAQQAIWNRPNEDLIFTGSVDMRQTNLRASPPPNINITTSTASKPTHLKTEVLQWNAREQKVWLPSPMSLEQDYVKLDAGMMTADQTLSVVELKNKVKILWQSKP